MNIEERRRQIKKGEELKAKYLSEELEALSEMKLAKGGWVIIHANDIYVSLNNLDEENALSLRDVLNELYPKIFIDEVKEAKKYTIIDQLKKLVKLREEKEANE